MKMKIMWTKYGSTPQSKPKAWVNGVVRKVNGKRAYEISEQRHFNIKTFVKEI
jgi:hypothetical protein